MVNGAPISCTDEDGEGDNGTILATIELIKMSRETVAFPETSPQKKLRVRGPGGDRRATITTVAKPSLSVMTGEFLDAKDCGRLLDEVMRLRAPEEIPLLVKTKDEAASYRWESEDQEKYAVRFHNLSDCTRDSNHLRSRRCERKSYPRAKTGNQR